MFNGGILSFILPPTKDHFTPKMMWICCHRRFQALLETAVFCL